MGIRSQDIERMKVIYPSFKFFKRDDSCVFNGEISLNHVFNDVRMTGKFNLEIIVPGDFPLAFPKVMELSDNIDKDYPHRYTNGQFCLASDLELKMFFSQSEDICLFVEKYIIPYLYTYRYYKEYGVYPYGDRSHGVMGNIEYLKDLFVVENWDQVFNLIFFIIQSPYRGHLMCPCGSGNRIRNCHGSVLKQMMTAGLREECKEILLECKKIYERKA